MKEEKIDITLNQEDVQNIIDCYEKDIELIEKLKERNKIYKTTIKGQHKTIIELRNAKKASKKVHKERNKKLKERIEYLERSNDRREEEILNLRADYGSKSQVERDLLEIRIDKAIEYINNCLIGYKEQYEEHTFNYYNVSYDLESILELLKGEKE